MASQPPSAALSSLSTEKGARVQEALMDLLAMGLGDQTVEQLATSLGLVVPSADQQHSLIWRNVHYGTDDNHRLQVFQSPDKDGPLDSMSLTFGERILVAEVKTVEDEFWLRIAAVKPQWVLASNKDGHVFCVELSKWNSHSGPIPMLAYWGQEYPHEGMYTEGYAGASRVCVVSASGDALWRTLNIELLFRDIPTSTVFEKQWGGDSNFMDWVAYFATNVVLYAELRVRRPKTLYVTVKNTANWSKYQRGCCQGPDPSSVRGDIGKAQFKECEWLRSMSHRLHLDWNDVCFVTVFSFLKEHCSWTQKDCQHMGISEMYRLLAQPGGCKAHEAEAAFWRLDEAFGGMDHWSDAGMVAACRLLLASGCEHLLPQRPPWQVLNTLAHVKLVAGGGHLLFLSADGQLQARGSNFPVPPQDRHWLAAAVGEGFCVAICSRGRLHAWGFRDLGAQKPPQPPRGQRFVAVAAGKCHAVALTDVGEVFAWGDNQFGQCNVPHLGKVVAICASSNTSLAIKYSGELRIWGRSGRLLQYQVPRHSRWRWAKGSPSWAEGSPSWQGAFFALCSNRGWLAYLQCSEAQTCRFGYHDRVEERWQFAALGGSGKRDVMCLLISTTGKLVQTVESRDCNDVTIPSLPPGRCWLEVAFFESWFRAMEDGTWIAYSVKCAAGLASDGALHVFGPRPDPLLMEEMGAAVDGARQPRRRRGFFRRLQQHIMPS